MRLDEPATRRKSFNLTPLIDVVFLLLVFFMLASTLMHFSRLPINSTRQSNANLASTKNKTILIHVLNAGEVRLNGVRTPTSELVSRLNNWQKIHNHHQALIIPRTSASVQDLISILALARTSRLRRIMVGK